jgi:hypothetical protein
MNSIFEFWKAMPTYKQETYVHPRDRKALERMPVHTFDLQTLPCNFGGRLKTASIVLLYLSPGLAAEADRNEVKHHLDRYKTKLLETVPLASSSDNPAAYNWWKSRTKLFGLDEEWIRYNVAILNIGAYHSRSFLDHGILTSLSSSRVAIEWAQEVLFPQAEAGERMAICMRAHRWWGLEQGRQYGTSLFSPYTTRSGHLVKDRMRETIVARARRLAW